MANATQNDWRPGKLVTAPHAKASTSVTLVTVISLSSSLSSLSSPSDGDGHPSVPQRLGNLQIGGQGGRGGGALHIAQRLHHHNYHHHRHCHDHHLHDNEHVVNADTKAQYGQPLMNRSPEEAQEGAESKLVI